MSKVAADNKTKKIAKRTGPGKAVRLWVRAKFLGFRRYHHRNPGPKSSRTSTSPSSNSRASTIEALPSTTSESGWCTSTKPPQGRRTRSLEPSGGESAGPTEIMEQ